MANRVNAIDRFFSSHHRVRKNSWLARNTALRILGQRDLVAFLAAQKEKIATVTFFAGAGSRWVESVKKAQAQGQAKHVDLEEPRCLAKIGGDMLPIGLYNLSVIRGLGKPYIVYRTHLPQIRQMVEQAGIMDATYIEQQVPAGLKAPLGHGDAIKQLLPHLPASVQFVITNFGGDVNSRRTIITSLLVLAALQQVAQLDRPTCLIPAAFMKEPKYPIEVDKKGLPLSFGHKKLKGHKATNKFGMTNVGIRIYGTGGLKTAVTEMERFYDPSRGYSIPGNMNNEFALDNIDSFLAMHRWARVLCVANKLEITGSIKSWEDVGRFLEAQKIIQSSDLV